MSREINLILNIKAYLSWEHILSAPDFYYRYICMYKIKVIFFKKNYELQNKHQNINVGWSLILNGGDNFIHTHICTHIHNKF